MTEDFQTVDVEDQLTRFSIADAAIAELAEQYMALTVKGLFDGPGYDMIRKARFDIRDKRIEVERVRKLLKSDALAYGRKVDGEAKRLTALLAPIEAHLKEQEKPFDDEKDRIKNIVRLTEWAIEEAEAKAKADAEESKRLVEAARLRAEREKLDAERREMEAEKARIAVEQKAIHDEKLRLIALETERLRAIEMEKAKAEAAEKASRETTARIAREAAAKLAAEQARVEAEEAARSKAEALRPDREKLLFVADEVAVIGVPKVSEAASEARIQVVDLLGTAEHKIRAIVEKMK